MTLPHDYAERVYAGVLGKLIGVYLGRPFENWTYERILAELGEITGYVNDKLNRPLVVTDDDISGTFTFLRALQDYRQRRETTAEQIGQTWLNYLIERRTVLWWGGMGNSTEHTAYNRLKQGIPAPLSGSAKTNGTIVSEQIGAQIFIDGWAMVAPDDPELASALARRAAGVSHDGEAIWGALVVAVMESLAFVEPDIDKLLDSAVTFIPRDSVIYRLIADLREWHATEPDWHKARQKLATRYGYDKYGGVCHMVPNHGVIILSLLYGGGDFNQSLLIANTCGWDTDCNSGNVGCLLGIRNGLAAFEGPVDWRGPIADQLFISSADGGRAITDAAAEALHIVNAGRMLQGLEALKPKQGARFHFELPGAVQGFHAEDNQASVSNVVGHSATGNRSLAFNFHVSPEQPARLSTATFILPNAGILPPYDLLASPTLYAGQTVQVALEADANNVEVVTGQLYISIYGGQDQLTRIYGPSVELSPQTRERLVWQIPDTDGSPVAEIGLEVTAKASLNGRVYLDFVTWDGTPETTLTRPARGGLIWRQAWVNAMDHFEAFWPEPYRVAHNQGRGMLIQGSRDWTDYEVEATLVPHMAKAIGLGIRTQGLRHYYALLVCDDHTARLVRHWDTETVLSTAPCVLQPEVPVSLKLQVSGTHLRAWANGQLVADIVDADSELSGGGVSLIVEEGCLSCDAVVVRPFR